MFDFLKKREGTVYNGLKTALDWTGRLRRRITDNAVGNDNDVMMMMMKMLYWQ